MYFKRVAYLILSVCISLLMACSDESREANLVDLHTLAQQNIISVSFPVGNETVFSANGNANFSLIGLQSNGIDQVTVTGVEWSLSAGAVSTIDQTGRLSAGAVAESITVTAKFGPLTDTLNIRISTAQFDQVTALHQQAFTIDMCRTQNLIPMGLYIGQNGAPNETRPVDSTIINTIAWSIVNQGETADSKRAHIETADDQAILRTLSAGDVVVQATATSIANGGQVTSTDFVQTIDIGLTAIKLCNSTDTDLANCAVTAVNLEENNVLPLVSVGTYQATNGSNEFIDITKNSQWGVSNNNEASIVYANNRQRIDVTGLAPNTNPVVTVACGNIVQDITGFDISQGVVLTESVVCPNPNVNNDCLLSSAALSITPLAVTSLTVSANNVDLITRQALTLTARPTEITLVVTATFSNNTNGDVTNNATLNYIIRRGAGIISNANNVAGVYTVSGAGTAEIEVTVDNSTQQFNAIIVIP